MDLKVNIRTGVVDLRMQNSVQKGKQNAFIIFTSQDFHKRDPSTSELIALLEFLALIADALVNAMQELTDFYFS